MNARQYRTEYNLSALDFPAIEGLGSSEIKYESEPFLINNKVKLKITKRYILVELYNNNKVHEVLSAMSVYEIPLNDIKSREDIHECYKDAMFGLIEAYEYEKKQLPLPDINFSTFPIEAYRKEIDRVFYLLSTLN